MLIAEHYPGLEDLARDELRRLGPQVQLLDSRDPAETRFLFQGRSAALLQLRTLTAVNAVTHFAVPRPKALLGHAHWQRLLGAVRDVLGGYPPEAFSTFRIAAAGHDSSVFRRIKEALSSEIGLRYNNEEADLQLRVRPADGPPPGWELLIRLTPRPLVTRDWRVFNYPGALNGAVAAAMGFLSQPRRDDRILNLFCGSGSLLIERAWLGPAGLLLGGDLDDAVLHGARANTAAARQADRVHLARLDVARLPLPNSCIDVLLADPPWGQLVGEQEALPHLYTALLREGARVARPGARLLVLTHSLRVWEAQAQTHDALWAPVFEQKVFQGGLYPRIYAYQRRGPAS